MDSAAVWNEPPEQSRLCPECARLRVQARAALLTADPDRLASLKAMTARHRATCHGEGAAA